MRKYENFCNALQNLKDIYNYDEPYDNVIMTGLVGLFEICFEQSWKAMKEILEDAGHDMAETGSPKQIIKVAYQAGMIGDENLWIEALKSRNNTSQSYNADIALDIIEKTKDKYYNMFVELKNIMMKSWL
ncbi:MAG: nucleotidyltransferase [Lachnospiraceae bacterium]|nr:nucleotidyltransferase [Lachnospiraceae bacterium]